jgi:hypothetical protein
MVFLGVRGIARTSLLLGRAFRWPNNTLSSSVADSIVCGVRRSSLSGLRLRPVLSSGVALLCAHQQTSRRSWRGCLHAAPTPQKTSLPAWCCMARWRLSQTMWVPEHSTVRVLCWVWPWEKDRRGERSVAQGLAQYLGISFADAQQCLCWWPKWRRVGDHATCVQPP